MLVWLCVVVLGPCSQPMRLHLVTLVCLRQRRSVLVWCPFESGLYRLGAWGLVTYCHVARPAIWQLWMQLLQLPGTVGCCLLLYICGWHQHPPLIHTPCKPLLSCPLPPPYICLTLSPCHPGPSRLAGVTPRPAGCLRGRLARHHPAAAPAAAGHPHSTR
jgi:hypothetical protein